MKPYVYLVAAFALSSACNGCLGCKNPAQSDGSNLPSQCATTQPLIAPQKLDILFIIDNSTSMIEEQGGVANSLVTFVDELRKGGGVATDFHVGVVTTSVYQHTLISGIEYLKYYPNQSGKLQPVPDLQADGGFTIGTGTERMLTGDDPDLIPKLSRLVRQGISGSGQETPFEAVRLALTEVNAVPMDQGGNGGFFRDRSRLLVVVLSDEDDCSQKDRPPTVAIGDRPDVDDCDNHMNELTPVSEYFRIYTHDALDTQGNTREIIWGEIAPVSTVNKAAMAVMDPAANNQVRNIDCPTSNAPGFRHVEMARLFDPSLSNLDSICRDVDASGNPNYTQTLTNIADLANVAQALEISGVPDPHMLQMAITRADSTVQVCTLANGGLDHWEDPSNGNPGRIFFSSSCKRRADDKAIAIKLLCANCPAWARARSESTSLEGWRSARRARPCGWSPSSSPGRGRRSRSPCRWACAHSDLLDLRLKFSAARDPTLRRAPR